MIQIFRIVCLIGLWLSALSLKEHVITKAGLAGSSFCKIGEGFDCSAVANSEWSEWFGFPLASWGIAFYTILFIFGLAARWEQLIPKKVSASVMLFFSSLASLFSVFLFIVSYISIGKLCPLCIGMYLVNFCLFFIAYRLVSPASFVQSWVDGIRYILKLPSVLLGKAAYSVAQKSLARLSVLVLAAILFFSSVAESYIQDKVVAPEMQEIQLVEIWKKQPLEDLKVERGQQAFADFYKGSSDSKIQIVEYSDFECPSCKNIFKVLDAVVKEYKQDVSLVHKNFPLDQQCNRIMQGQLHENACYFANFARCAGEQAKFWEVAEIIYDTKEHTGNVKQSLSEAVSSLGLDMQALNECVDNGRQLEVIKKDIERAIELDIQGTPTIWVNGKKFEGRTERDFRQLFDFILKK